MRPRTVLIGVATGLLVLLAATPALATTPGPALQVTVQTFPTNFVAGTNASSYGPAYLFVATNVGAAPTVGSLTFTDTVPAGLSVVKASDCQIVGQDVTCTRTTPLAPGRHWSIGVFVDVDQSTSGPVFNEGQISGGEALPVSVSSTTVIGDPPPPFGFLSGFSAPLTAADGTAVTQAGSHPNQLSVDASFPTARPTQEALAGAGHLRDLSVDLPPGEIINPTATTVRCTEAQLTAEDEPTGCPDASQIGTLTITTVGSVPEASTTPLFNMVTPSGAPASFGSDVLGVGVFAHIIGEVRSGGDFGLSGFSTDLDALGVHPIFGVRVELWSDPSSSSHDAVRGLRCGYQNADLCPANFQTKDAFLTAPLQCTGQPAITSGHAVDWEKPTLIHNTSYESADLSGNPVSIDGCNSLEFKPTISVKPTTDLADSPSGLDVTLHQPQNTELGENGEGRATASLRDATVTLPAGMAVNPSQADGLAGCSAAQIGLTTGVGETPIHFSKAPDDCPDAAKLGKVEVTTPLLAQYSADGTKPITDPETGDVIPRPLEGAVYLAEPYQNPFDSLLAIYLSIDDPASGTIAKLAGRVIPDPVTGQLTTVFEENPQLPLEDVTLHLFGGAHGALITPPTCGTHTTTTDLVPWSAPEGESAHPSSSFNTTASPDGGACPATESAAPNAPTFSAGTISPQAGAYSPFVLKLSRNDGSQRLTKLETTLPPGLAARFAGVGQCTEAQIAQAQSRSHPGQGALEKSNPSCPPSSELGTVTVGAGAGPTPYYTQGTAYLAGPYKSAPFSLAIITPAIAGPFDLGTVVVRTALHVNPDTAQGRAVSDPLPTILEGIPLDVRSVAIEIDRPGFTLNPTSCDPMAVTGTATSSLGALAALTSPFQVGGCPSLPFKPKLALQLKGPTKRTSHPRLIANLTAKPGEANIARTQVKLPPSAFLDQGHIKTICTRVQFKADTCPPGSIYGKASATTPLLDGTLSGGVYLRSSSHNLPDLVVKLKGPAAQPIEIDLVGRTDSIKGALRNTFEAVPDAPVSKFHLELFGGKRGLVELSSGFCKHPKATVQMEGQNGKAYDTRPVVGSSCKKKGKKKGGKRHGKGGGHP